MEIWRQDQAYKRDAEGVTMAERNKMLAYMFLDGADKTMFGYLVKNMGNDYALGNDTYPEDVESALQVLLLYQEGVYRKSTKKKNIERNNGEMVELSFAQMTVGVVAGLVKVANGQTDRLAQILVAQRPLKAHWGPVSH